MSVESFYLNLSKTQGKMDFDQIYQDAVLNIEFDDTWYVGLTEIFINAKIVQLPRGTPLIRKYFYLDVEKKWLPLAKPYVTKHDISFNSLQQLVEGMNDVLKHFEIRFMLFNNTNKIQIKHFDNTKKKQEKICFYNKLSGLLGFLPNKRYNFDDVGDFPIDLYGGMRNVYIYSSIIKNRRVSDVFSPLLQVIPLNQQSNISHFSYKNPQYVIVDKKLITDIKIYFRDHTAEEISVNKESLYIYLVLHFFKQSK